MRKFAVIMVSLVMLLVFCVGTAGLALADDDTNSSEDAKVYKEMYRDKEKYKLYLQDEDNLESEVYNLEAIVTTQDGIKFDTSTGTITDYIGSATTLNIPSTINGVSVVAIGDCAFQFCEDITSVSIPSSVKRIGRDAFYGWGAC